MVETHELLQGAARDSELAYDYNKDKPNHMRISRVGQPLVSLLLEDFVFSRLPEFPTAQKTERQRNADYVKRKMAQATGYLFEQVVIDVLRQDPNLLVLPQFKVDLGYLSGTADIVVVNVQESRATVIECKALKYGTKKEACKQALFNDTATGYLSQLAVYRAALEIEYSLYEVDACWMVWCKESASLFRVPFSESGADPKLLMLDASLKAFVYNQFKSAFDCKDFSYCLNALDLSSMPPFTPSSYNDGFRPTCSAQYSSWYRFLADAQGELWEEAKDHLELMLKVSLLNDGQAKEKLLELI